jgi:methylmalonyl-CoA/ethylmalonyl-CoA epimerase
MAIVRLQHIGIVVKDFTKAWNRFDQILGMRTRDFRNDQSKGMQHDARVLLGDGCWIHVVFNWNPETRVYRFLEEQGEGLEHIAIETDDIEKDVERLRDQNIPIFEDNIFDANDGYEAFVYPENGIGFTVELIQPHASSWNYPDASRSKPISTKLGVYRAPQLTAVVDDVDEAQERFARCFGLEPRENGVPLGDNCQLRLINDDSSPPRHRGLRRLTLETRTLESDLEYLKKRQVPISPEGVLDAERGVGFEVDLISS